jgi:hypothetical protein
VTACPTTTQQFVYKVWLCHPLIPMR